MSYSVDPQSARAVFGRVESHATDAADRSSTFWSDITSLEAVCAPSRIGPKLAELLAVAHDNSETALKRLHNAINAGHEVVNLLEQASAEMAAGAAGTASILENEAISTSTLAGGF